MKDGSWKNEILLEVGGFDEYGGVEITTIQAYVDFQKHNLGGRGVPSELDGTVAIATFKELREGLGIMRPKEENVIGKTQ